LKYGDEETWYPGAKVYENSGMQGPFKPFDISFRIQSIVKGKER
jgi:hypothetical protein